MTDRKAVIVTGASAGIGKATARQLLDRGWRVIGIGRDAARCAQAAVELDSPAFTMLRADLSLLSETAILARQIAGMAPQIDAIINNAGGVQSDRLVTREGFESTLAANHLAPFLLTQKLMPCFRTGSRIIAVSSTGHEHCPGIRWDDLNFEKDWTSGGAYCQAKLANILFTRELARRHGPDGLIAHAMHPGVVDSNFSSHCEPGMRAYMESLREVAVTPDHPARTLIWLADSKEAGRTNGLYHHNMQAIPASAAAMDDAAARRLWDLSLNLVAGY